MVRGERRERPARRLWGTPWYVTVFKGLSWWQGVLVFAPVLLTVEGGAVGGLFGSVAALCCGALARRGWHALLTAAAMVCIDALAWGAYLGVAALLFGAHVLPWSGPAVPQAGQAFPQAPATLAPLLAVPQASQQPSSCASPAAAVPGPSAPGGTAGPPVGSGAASADADEVMLRSGSGAGQTADFTGTRIAVSGTADRAQIGAGPYSITLLGNLGCGAHADVSPADPGSGPQVLVEVNGRGCGNFDGAITVYEMATDSSGAITRLNAAFSRKCNEFPAPLAGFVRYHATRPTPVPAVASTSLPIVPPPNSGTTSAHPDEFSVLSDSSGGTGGVQPFDYAGPDIRVTGSWGKLDVSVGDASDLNAFWRMTLSAPVGQQLVPGTYPWAASAEGIDASGTGFGIEVVQGDVGCDSYAGTFTVYQITADPSGAVTQLNATFSERCQSPNQPDPKAGFIRFNATAPTPVPVLPGP